MRFSGERLRELRKGAGLTQAELAEKLDVSRTCVLTWEKNICPPSLANLGRLAAIFKIAYTFFIVDKTEDK